MRLENCDCVGMLPSDFSANRRIPEVFEPLDVGARATFREVDNFARSGGETGETGKRP